MKTREWDIGVSMILYLSILESNESCSNRVPRPYSLKYFERLGHSPQDLLWPLLFHYFNRSKDLIELNVSSV